MSVRPATVPDPSDSGPRPGIRGVAELTLEAPDLTAMEYFYGSLIGLEVLDREEEDRVWLAIDRRTRLGLWSPGVKEFGDRGGRHVHLAFSVNRGALEGLAERLRTDQIPVRGPIQHPGGDRSIYFRDPADNVVEAWDFFERGEGAADGVAALK